MPPPTSASGDEPSDAEIGLGDQFAALAEYSHLPSGGMLRPSVAALEPPHDRKAPEKDSREGPLFRERERVVSMRRVGAAQPNVVGGLPDVPNRPRARRSVRKETGHHAPNCSLLGLVRVM